MHAPQNSGSSTATVFLGWLLAVTVSSWTPAPGYADEAAWYRSSLVGLEVGPTGAQFGHSDQTDTRYCRDFDGRQIVERTVAAGGEYLVLWARDGDYAYYDSQLLPKAPGLGDRDPLREAVAAARDHQLPLIAYCVVQQAGHFLAAHPEWAMRDSAGNPLGRFCLNSGYLSAMKEIVSEQLAYGIDGFHIDMLDQGFGPPYGCWCSSCQDQFQQMYGEPQPRTVSWDSSWDKMLDFRYRSSAQFERELAAHIRQIAPQATVDFNYHGNPPFSFEVGQRPVQHAGNGDFVTGETGVWGFSALGVGLNAQFYRAATPGLPYQVAMQRGVRMYHDQTTRPRADLQWELFTLLSHGAFVTIVDKTGFDGWLDPVAYQRFGELFAEVDRKRAHFGHSPVQDVGLYFSSRTRDWWGREQPARYFLSFAGAHRTCAMEHIPFGVVLDENATLERLRQFPIVCLPNAAILEAEELQRLRGYVQAGGHLVLTGFPGQFDRYGEAADVAEITTLIGARPLRRLDSWDNWVRLPRTAAEPGGAIATQPQAADAYRNAIAPDLPVDVPFLVKGPATVYEPTTAVPVGQLWAPYRTTRQLQGQEGTEWPMSAEKSVGPAVLVHPLGEGMVVTLAAAADYATASEHAVVEARLLLRNVLRLLQPRPRLRIVAPAHVEAVVTDDPQARRLRVHLLAYQPTPRSTPATRRPYVLPGLIEDTPMFRVSVSTDFPVRHAEATNDNTHLTQEGQQVTARIEAVHEVLVLEY